MRSNGRLYRADPDRPSSFDGLDETTCDRHLAIGWYGDFELTQAIRPSYDLAVVPQEGFRFGSWENREAHKNIPFICASVTRKKLFDLFLSLVAALGPMVDVVLESHHPCPCCGQNQDMELYREDIDTPVLASQLYDFDDLLLNDGFTGINALNPHTETEVQWSQHKLIFTYAQTRAALQPFQQILKEWNIPHLQRMKVLFEGEHVHCSSEDFRRRFSEICTRLGADASGGNASFC